MKKLTVIAAALASIGFGALPLRAQPMGPPRMGRMMHGDSPGMMLRLVLKQADLTPEQQSQVHKIIDTEHQSLRTLFSQLEAANNRLAAKLFAPGAVQASDLTPEMQQIAQLRQQLMEHGVKTALAVRAVLKPEQLAKVGHVKDQVEKLQAEMRGLLDGSD